MDVSLSAISSRASSQEMRAEAAFAFGAGAPQRMEQARGRVFAFEIARYFAAEEAARDGVRRDCRADWMPRPVSSTLIRSEQASGQSSAQTEWRVSVTCISDCSNLSGSAQKCMPSLAFEQARQRVGTLGIGALLASAGGFLDGFTYVGHGHVFANAMTGNVVLLGISCFSGSWQHRPSPSAGDPGLRGWHIRVGGDAVAFETPRCQRPLSRGSRLEIGVLLVLSLLPATTADILFTTSIAFAASVQVQTFREVNGHSFNSTFTTGNLRTLSEAAFELVFGRP